MTSRVSRAPVRKWIRLALWPLRALGRASRMFLMALAGALGPPPKPFRHEDTIALVAEDDAVNE